MTIELIESYQTAFEIVYPEAHRYRIKSRSFCGNYYHAPYDDLFEGFEEGINYMKQKINIGRE